MMSLIGSVSIVYFTSCTYVRKSCLLIVSKRFKNNLNDRLQAQIGSNRCCHFFRHRKETVSLWGKIEGNRMRFVTIKHVFGIC